MPLSSDEKVKALSNDVLQALDNLNGVHPGFRAVHAKGILLSGTFVPSLEAKSLTKAPHAQRASTPVTLRFSDSAGFPTVADNDPNAASPRGSAIRFHLAEHVHTDIIAHSADAFPARTAEEFLEFLRAAGSSGPDAPKPTPIERFLATHPAALAFVQLPKPIPVSFAREAYFSVVAYKFVGADGTARFIRYRIRPAEGTEYLDAAAAAAKGANFLMEDITARIAQGPVVLQIWLQVAAEGDAVADATIHWPKERPEVLFGTVTLTAAIAPDDKEAARIIFDPLPRVDGIESSGDPLLEPRADVYLLSGRRRRAAAEA